MFWLAYIVLSACVRTTNSLYFHMGETEKKCFIEEIPEETMVTANYRVQLFDEGTKTYLPASQGVGVQVEIFDPNTEYIMSKYYAAEGRFFFTSHMPGEHHICMLTNSTKWRLFAGGKLRVHIEFRVGEHANDYTAIAEKEKLTDIELRMRQVIDQVLQISKEQTYQRIREEQFRATSESTNSRVLWWATIQTAVLVMTAVWQMRHLKGFFEAKKLV